MYLFGKSTIPFDASFRRLPLDALPLLSGGKAHGSSCSVSTWVPAVKGRLVKLLVSKAGLKVRRLLQLQ
jgi:hypothetical protein